MESSILYVSPEGEREVEFWEGWVARRERQIEVWERLVARPAFRFAVALCSAVRASWILRPDEKEQPSQNVSLEEALEQRQIRASSA